jgi:hypothetical protein
VEEVYRIAVLENIFLINVYIYIAICDICSDYFDNCNAFSAGFLLRSLAYVYIIRRLFCHKCFVEVIYAYLRQKVVKL